MGFACTAGQASRTVLVSPEHDIVQIPSAVGLKPARNAFGYGCLTLDNRALVEGLSQLDPFIPKRRQVKRPEFIIRDQLGKTAPNRR